MNNQDFFTGYNQYINWFPTYNSKTGKYDKIPIDPHSLKSYEQAKAQGNVGFMFTEKDPFFFIDIDNALETSGAWSALALSVCETFSGCAMEVSHSGRGLHIFGTGKPIAPHKNKNKALNIEVYTRDRFAALTGDGAVGSVFREASAELNIFLEEYFYKPPDAPAIHGPQYEAWSGPEDDKELLKIALRSRSAASVFGQGVSFKQLYEADAGALSAKFPSDKAHGFDWSSADAALLSHLAFYTGCDAGRMERIFNMSELAKRDKWTERSDYRERSINFAISRCGNVYRGKKSTDTMPAEIKTGSQYCDIQAQLELFKGCAYVIAPHKIFTPARGLLRPEQFKAVFGGRWFAVAAEGKPTKNAFEAFTESQIYDFPFADDICFRPEETPGKIIFEEGRKLVNTYEPVKTESLQIDATPFLDLLEKLFPNETDRTILLSYLAACVQFPGVKFQWAPLIQGAEGNGKTFLATALSRAIGRKYTHLPKVADLKGNGLKFNGWLYGKLFVAVEELTAADVEVIQQALGEWITNEFIEFQFKGGHQFVGDNRANFLFFSNYKDALKITENNRRYCPFYTAQQVKKDLNRDGLAGDYFPKLYNWAKNKKGWAGITWYLKNYTIDEKFNPAGNCQRAPETSSTKEAFRSSLGAPEQEILEAIGQEKLGFRGGWISSVAVDKLLTDKKLKVPLNKRKSMLENLGYILKERMNNPSPADGSKKPVLYVLPEFRDIKSGAGTAEAYIKAQRLIPN